MDSLASFEAAIEVVEPVGNEIFIYFSTGTGDQFVARVATDSPPPVGKPHQLFLDSSRLHFFDKNTGQAF